MAYGHAQQAFAPEYTISIEQQHTYMIYVGVVIVAELLDVNHSLSLKG